MRYKKGAISYITLMVLMILLGITLGLFIYSTNKNIMKTGSKKVGEVQSQILENTQRNILIIKCGSKDPSPLIEFLKNYGTVSLDTIAEPDDDMKYDVVVLYDCDLSSSEENILSWGDRVKIIGIGPIGDESFRRELFRVEGYQTRYLSLGKLSKIIVPDSSLLSDKLTVDFIRPENTNIEYILNAKCNAINLANLDPWDSSNSQSDVGSAVCLSRNRLFFSYDINNALKEKQSLNLIKNTFDFFLG